MSLISLETKEKIHIAWMRFSIRAPWHRRTNFKKLMRDYEAMSPSLKSKLTLENLEIARERFWGKG